MRTVTLQAVRISAADQYRRLPPAAAELPPFDPALLDQHRPDDHWAILDGDHVGARCSLWWRNTPRHDGQRVGLIGHYAADSSRSARSLLKQTCTQLARRGCALAIGPVDGSTWRDYRFVTLRGGRPAFCLEPDTPDTGPGQFLENGFHEWASYFSAIVEDLSHRDPRVQRAQRRLLETGIRLRRLQDNRIEADLRQICFIVNRSFQDHLLFAPVGEAEFLAQFGALRQVVPNELVLIAEQGQQIVGFCFGLPDLRQAQSGLRIDTAILKTFGVLRGRRFAGLGQVLLEQFHHQALCLGFSSVIHALVREAGHMQRMSGRYAVPFRKYALFARELAP